LIKQVYDSDIMELLNTYTPSLHRYSLGVLHSDYFKYILYTHGIVWIEMSSNSSTIIEGKWFMPFSEIGYLPLNDDDELFAFAFALFCSKNKLKPEEIDVEEISWNYETKSDSIGLFVSEPQFKKKIENEPHIDLRQIFAR